MEHFRFLSDKSLLLRQAIWGWIITVLGTLLFVLIALLLSFILPDTEHTVIVASLLVTPVLILVHFRLARQDYFTNDLIQRVVDFVIGQFCVVLIMPLMIIVAVAIKLESSGPVFYWRHILVAGKERSYLKFRTMYMDSEDRLTNNHYRRDDISQGYRLKKDPRITRVGWFLRRTGLHSLPMIFSVIKGDASFFGQKLSNIEKGSKSDMTKRLIWLGDGFRLLNAQELAGYPINT